MSEYQFQIVWHGLTRYAWELVEVTAGQRVIIDRSSRSWRSRKKVKADIDRLTAATAAATVIDTTQVAKSPQLTFQVLPDVQPLPVTRFVTEPEATIRSARYAGAAVLAQPASTTRGSTPAQQVSLAVASATTQEHTHARITALAYSLWETDGHKEGYDVDYWLKAEAAILQATGNRP